MTPRVLVALPTFRRAGSGLLAEAVESVLGQSLGDLRLVIVDDGSTDGTAEVVAEYAKQDDRVAVLTHERNTGLPALCVNEAVLRGDTPYVAYMFDDDRWEPHALEVLVGRLDERPDVDMVYGDVELPWLDAAGERHVRLLGSEPETFDRETLEQANFIANIGVVHRRACFDSIGMYDPHILLRRLCDWDLWLRIARKHRVERVPCVVGEARGLLTDDSLGRTVSLAADVTRRYMRFDRDRLLKPEVVRDRVIDDLSLFGDELEPSEREAAYALFAEYYRQAGDAGAAARYSAESGASD